MSKKFCDWYKILLENKAVASEDDVLGKIEDKKEEICKEENK